MRKLLACIFFLVAPLLAQARFQTSEAPTAATGPSFEMSLGYVYFNMATPSQRIGLTGVDATAQVRFSSHWAAVADATYARTGNVFGTGRSANVLSFLAGPVFYPLVFAKTGVFVHALAGASRVESAVPVSGTTYLDGRVARPSYEIGGGIEHSLFAALGVRIQGDYQRTAFGDSAGAIQGQNNLRLTTSMIYRFGGRRE